MELLLILLIGLAIGGYAYRTGKQTGSRRDTSPVVAGSVCRGRSSVAYQLMGAQSWN